MDTGHWRRVRGLLEEAAAEHDRLRASVPAQLRESLPVDAQGITRAIDHLATAAGLYPNQRRDLIRPHGANPAVLHARVFGAAPLARETVIGAFIEGARVRADALAAVADAVGEGLGQDVRRLLTAYPPPVDADAPGAVAALHDTYAAHERAALLIAARLDDTRGYPPQYPGAGLDR